MLNDLSPWPNFLIIGASKGGTTTLQYVLEKHPDVFMCPEKETGFFWAYGEDLSFEDPGSKMLSRRLVCSADAYVKLFKKVRGEKAVGEASVLYLPDSRTPNKIKELVPGMRLIVILRHPVERAYSSFLHNRRDGIEDCKEFVVAIREEQKGQRENWLTGRYLNRSFYYEAIERYLKIFPKNQLFIGLLLFWRREVRV